MLTDENRRRGSIGGQRTWAGRPVCAAPGCKRRIGTSRPHAARPDLCAPCERATRANGSPAVVRRDRRLRGQRARSVPARGLTRVEVRVGLTLLAPEGVARPRTRVDCADLDRPCPFVSCRHHLYLDVNPDTGTIKLNFPGLEPHELRETCSLDVADRDGVTLEEIGRILNLTRERVRQIETRALLKVKMDGEVERPIEGRGGVWEDWA